MKGPRPTPAIDRVMRRTRIEGDCLIYVGSLNNHGYGRIGIGSLYDGTRRMTLAHRVVFEHVYGDLPLGHEVCHSCDRPSCVKPEHLWSGTRSQNLKDMVAKGRWSNGRQSGASHGSR